MRISYKLTDECKKKYISANFDTKIKTILKIILLICSIILAVISFMALIAKDWILFVFPSIFSIIGFYVTFLPKILKRKYIKSLNANYKTTVEVDENKLFIENPSRTVAFNYSEIKSINLVNDYFVFIKFKQGDSVVIPKYAFTSNAEILEFINKIKTKAGLL